MSKRTKEGWIEGTFKGTDGTRWNYQLDGERKELRLFVDQNDVGLPSRKEPRIFSFETVRENYKNSNKAWAGVAYIVEKYFPHIDEIIDTN